MTTARRKRKLEPKPGLNRFVWDLTHDGATVIPGAPVDSGAAAARVPVAPGTYTVRLDGRTADARPEGGGEMRPAVAESRMRTRSSRLRIVSLKPDPQVQKKDLG